MGIKENDYFQFLFFRCTCSVINGNASERENVVFNYSEAFLPTRPSRVYISKKDKVPNRTFFSTPFGDTLKEKRKEYSERKVLGWVLLSSTTYHKKPITVDVLSCATCCQIIICYLVESFLFS